MSQTETAIPETRRADRRYFLFVAATVVPALVLRAWSLRVRGALDYDETYYYLLGKSLFAGKGYMLNGLPHTAFPPLYPIFTGLTGLFSDNVLFCTAFISAIAGALLPIPVYFLGRDMYNRRVGAMAAALTAVWPTLWFFAVRNIPYSMRMYCGSEPLFITLFIMGLLYLWLAARRDTLLHGAIAGALIGLSVLDRNEATVMFAFLLMWFVVDRFFFSALPRRRQALQVGTVAVAFVIAVSPWVIYVHSVSGKWNMGSKLSNLTRTRPGLYNWIVKGQSVNYVKRHYQLSADATQLEDDYWGVTEWHKHHRSTAGGIKAAIGLVIHPDGRWLPVLWHIFTDDIPPLVPRYIWPVLLLGAVLPPSGFRWRRGALLYGTLIFVLVLQAVTIYAIARFQLPILPLLAILAARGLDAVARGAAFVTGILTKRLSLEPIGYAVPAAAMALMIWGGVWFNTNLPKMIHKHTSICSTKYDKELSSVLKAELPPGSSVMCNKPWVPLYAGMEWRSSPFGASELLAKYSISRKIDFAVLGPWQLPKVQPGMGLYPYLVRKITLSDGEEQYLFDFRNAWKNPTGS